ncbi:MAG: class I SAM-dependent methyltransferase [Candidatus Omnitrophica bacterium]|nr:class I SAM-dependent methyltransferase [Candidatus Omnitrophota bacterium]MBU1996156.1 class I SAM-dependent methyltransferase [Candidatus Omnitrophota bacterium]MBU4333642.1 class I SAM-dependent methyltransferase [Candidatus Omnitrophota bacterium]
MKKDIRKQYAGMADGYDLTIRQLIPKYDHIMKRMASFLPYDKNQAIDILDIGCGTGNLAFLLKKKFFYSNITCIDPTDKMIKYAKQKLSVFPGIKYVKSMVQDFKFNEKYDAVLVSMVFQNLRNKRQKMSIYRKICKSLKQDGMFLMFGPVLGSNDFVEEYYMKHWSAFIQKSFNKEKTEGGWLATYREKDGPDKFLDEISMLQKSGFKTVDVVYKDNNLALFVMVK